MAPSVKKHILLLSFPAYGHMIPLLELGKKISKHHHVSFAVSAIKLDQLKKREPSLECPDYGLKLIGVEDGYLEEFDTRMMNPDDHFAILNDMIQCITPGTTTFLASVINRKANKTSCPPVDVVISDNFIGCPLMECNRYGVPFYLFNTTNAGLALGIATASDNDPIWTEPKDVPVDAFFRAPAPGQPPPPIPESFHQFLLERQKLIPLSAGIIVNSFREIEQPLLAILNSLPVMEGVNVSCVGPLVPKEQEENAANQVLAKKVKKWLDEKEESSVAYISFGSLALPTPEQLLELGEALLLLKKPCILSLREVFHVHLPKEIRDQIAAAKGQILVLPWSPQKDILTHPAARVFVSHCGWNSTLESLFGGIPIVGWPMFAEQLANAELVARFGLGRLIQGTGVNPERVVPRKEIAETIADVAGWGTGDATETTFTTTAKTWKDKIDAALGPNGSSQKEFDELVKFSDNKKQAQ